MTHKKSYFSSSNFKLYPPQIRGVSSSSSTSAKDKFNWAFPSSLSLKLFSQIESLFSAEDFSRFETPDWLETGFAPVLPLEVWNYDGLYN